MDATLCRVIMEDREIAYAITDTDLHIVTVGGNLAVLGIDSSAASGLSLPDWVPELVGCEDILHDILSGRLPRFELCGVNRETQTGGTLYLTVVELPYRDESDQIVGLLHVVQDISEMSALYQDMTQRRNELSLLEERLAHQHRQLVQRSTELLEANTQLEAFTNSVSHDLRSPLQTIQGFAEILIKSPTEKLGPEGLRCAQRIALAAQAMAKTMEDLLAYSRLRRVELEVVPVSLKAIVQQAHAQVEADLRRSQGIITVVGKLPKVMGHQAILVQAVANLLTNAVKFVAPGTVPEVRIRAQGHAGWVRLWVEDNGIGIAPGDRERIFRPFERLVSREHYASSGIGLAIVKTAVARLGGQVGVESELERGSRFWLELRRA
jgi:signal transduction histidine kinase